MENGKKYNSKIALRERGKLYPVTEAVKLVKELSYTKFDGTVEAVFRLGIDPRKSDQQVRGTVSLPNGTGKSIRIAVITAGDKENDARNAGADIVGGDSLIEEIQKGKLDFDMIIASPDMMAKVGRLGKVLGPKGLMPTPKTGTVTTDIARAVKDFKAGKVEYRSDKQSNVHTMIGKVSFTPAALEDNFNAIFEAIIKAKPASAKGIYLKSVFLAPTMGPSVRVAVSAT